MKLPRRRLSYLAAGVAAAPAVARMVKMAAGKFLILTSVAAFFAAGTAVIAEPAAPGGAAPSEPNDAAIETLWQFGKQEKLCIEWTDGCRGCRRDDADAISCSNIGIACQPQEIRCTLRKSEKPN